MRDEYNISELNPRENPYASDLGEEDPVLMNSDESDFWVWQCDILYPDGQPITYPICPFCTTAPFRPFGKAVPLPDRCPTCGARLEDDR